MTRDEVKAVIDARLDELVAKQIEKANRTGNRQVLLGEYIGPLVDVATELCRAEYERGLSEAMSKVN
jgi:hypothetical protein